VAAPEAGHVLKAPDDVVPAHGAEQEDIQGQGGGTHVAVPEDEPAEQPDQGAVGGIVEIAVAVHEEQEHVLVSQVGARRNPFGTEDAVLVGERQVPGLMPGHEVQHAAGQLVVVDPRVPGRGYRVDGPRFGAFGEELVLVAGVPAEPVVDRVGRDRCGQGPEVFRRRAGDAGELLEAPVRQARLPAGGVAEGERIGGHGFGPESDRLDRVLLDAGATGTGRFEEGVHAGVPLVGWPCGPFPVSRVRGDCRHT
jgi:hypothetical protein